MEGIFSSLEFENVKQIRRNLLIASVIGIAISQLAEYSVGDVSFFGFTLPENNKPLLGKIFGYLILFYIIVFGIRFFDEKFQEKYIQALNSIQANNEAFIYVDTKASKAQKDYTKSVKNANDFRKGLIFFLDIIVPLLVGIVAILFCFGCF